MTLWMKVTKDKYELPIAVAGSAAELARMVGKTQNAIRSRVSHAKKEPWRCSYVRVEVDDDDPMDEGHNGQV